ncbi:serine hydrolase [Micromonospora sp. HM5-17]|uniref:serine hydrolase domain-containing protein n=1 Tax=Micromonospora sp. HM5-17 TaxID=2487710 RepID=UPI0011CE59EA|nr:serine hydrolase domain-containing protein [Micromonospora sp. HM5-17]
MPVRHMPRGRGAAGRVRRGPLGLAASAAVAALVLAVSTLPGPALAAPSAAPSTPSTGAPPSATPAIPGPGPAASSRAVPAEGDLAGGQLGDRVGRARDYLRRHMSALRIPGLAYAVVHGDRVVDQGAWGVDGDGAPLTVETPFVLGSVSKSFTALAVMQLVEAGQVELDAPVRRYVPWFRLADESAAARITVRQLLIQTSGLPQVAALGLTDRYDNTPGALARSVRDLAAVRPTAEPGATHQYSDANYQILGVLVEEVTGQTYAEYLRRNVLDPLRMTRSAATEAEARAIGGIPAGHRYYLGRPRRFDPPFDGSGISDGFLAASPADLTHYLIAQLNGGRYGDRQVLSAAGVAQLHAGQVATGGTGRYALGWRDDVLSGLGDRVVWHAGATANFFGHLLVLPDSELAVVVLANSYSLALDGPLVAAGFNVARILRGGSPVAAEADPTFTWVLGGLLAVLALLLALVAWSLVRAVRLVAVVWGRRAGAAPPRGRTATGTLAWVAGCAALALGTGWGLPALWDGAGLAQVLLFAPDLGHAAIAVVLGAALLGLVRLGLGGYLMVATRPKAGGAVSG